MTFKEIQEVIKLINKSNLSEFKLKNEGFELTIRTKKYGKTPKSLVAQPQHIVPIQSVQPQYAPPAPPQAAPVAPVQADLPPSNVAKEADAAASNTIEVKSPIVGTFYRSPSPDKPAYIKVGNTIEVGDVVCIVEAMKLFNEIESEVKGKVVKVMVEDAQPVEYDQVLFLVDPNG